MRAASAYQRALGILAFFTVAAGDFWRYLLSWWGWGAIAALVLVLGIVELVRARVDLRRLPLSLLAFLLLCLVSVFWSAYPGATVLGLAATFATTTLAVFLACCYRWDDVRGMLTASLRWVLGLSLLFELCVSLFVRQRVLPFWVDYSELEKIPAAFYWSRNLLFDGGRIQGIVGNSNILGMLAVIGLVLFVLRLALHKGSPLWGWFWVVVAVLTIALTRSSTALVVLVVVTLVVGYVFIVRRTTGRARMGAYLGGAVVAASLVTSALVFSAPLLKLLGKRSDLTYRLDIWDTVWNVAIERPAAGWGWVSYWVPWVEPFDDLVVIRGVTYLQAHNAWLDVFLQLGVIGLVVFGLFVATALVRSWLLAIDGTGTRTGVHGLAWPASALPLVLLAGLLTQSLAESRLLIELGWTLLVIIAVKTSWPDTARDDRLDPPVAEASTR
jgi:O-antigen ligase